MSMPLTRFAAFLLLAVVVLLDARASPPATGGKKRLCAQSSVNVADNLIIFRGGTPGAEYVGKFESRLSPDGSPGDPEPAGPTILFVFGEFTKEELAQYVPVNRAAAPGTALRWTKGKGAKVDRESLRRATYFCSFEPSATTEELKAMLLRQ
jgi:hypothetical protein